MIWEDYIKGYKNLPEYLFKKYGTAGKYKLEEMETRLPVGLEDKFKLVESIYDMEFGHFIMAEMALTSGKENNEVMYNLANAVLRPISDDEFDNSDLKKEEEHIKKVLLEHAKDVLNECTLFSEKRNKFVKKDFNGVFYKDPDEDEDNDKEEDLDNGAEQTFEESFNKDWYWYNIATTLAGNDILKIEPIMMMKMKYVAPHLAYLRMKGIIEYKRRKMEEVANKIKQRR